MEQLELTTMCAVIHNGKVLMINRRKSWKGWAFPGGHLERDESVLACVKRELFEETGLTIEDIHFKGITDILNSETKRRHIVFNYVADSYHGTCKEQCDEGEIAWIDIDNILKLELAEGMEYRLPLFLEPGVKELFIEWNETNGYINVQYHGEGCHGEKL